MSSKLSTLRKSQLMRLLSQNRPIKCEKCGGGLVYKGSGEYACQNCGYSVLDDYGKVKTFLQDHGLASAWEVCEATGVSMEIVEMLLKDGRIEITEGADYYFVRCERCGCSLRYGRFCPDCYRLLSNELKESFGPESAGEKPVKERKKFTGFLNSDGKSKMRYFQASKQKKEDKDKEK